MRIGLSIVALMMFGGCDYQAGQFDHQATLHTQTRGVVVHENGDVAQAGMFGTTCDVYTGDASIGTDYDYASDEEVVTDIHMGEVLIVSPDSIIIQDGRNAGEVAQPGVVDSRLTDDGFVSVSGNDAGCSVSWTGDMTVSTAVDSGLCNSTSMSVDRTNGNAFVGTADGAFGVDADGATQIDTVSDLISWDPTAEVLYAATSGGIEVLGLEADGTERWSVQLDGAVASLEAMGTLGQAVVSIQKYSGHGEIVTIDGITGEVLTAVATPSAADDLASSEDGSMVAVTTESAVHFFKMGE